MAESLAYLLFYIGIFSGVFGTFWAGLEEDSRRAEIKQILTWICFFGFLYASIIVHILGS